MARHVVATVDEIAPGQSRIVSVRGREIGVFNVKGDFYALINRCPHEGAALCKGRITGRMEADRPGEYRLTDWRAPDAAPFARPSVPYCVLHVGASSRLKLWESEYWKALAAHLRAAGVT